MKHVKVFEEFYSIKDLQDLVDTLSTVGLADKFKVECNLFIMIPDKMKNGFDWPEWAFRNIEVEVICADDRQIILEKAFEKVLLGEFVQEENTYLDGMFRSAPELVETLGKPHIIDLAERIKENPNLTISSKDGPLYSLQFLLSEEIEGLMIERLPKRGDEIQTGVEQAIDQRGLRHLNENIGYNVKILKN